MPNPTTSKRSPITAIQGKSAPNKAAQLPTMPKSLPSEYRTEWRALVQHLRDIDAWLPQKSGLVESYLINLQAIRTAQAVMAADGGILAGGKPHPASPIITRHMGILTKLAGQLGLGKEKLTPNAPAKSAAASPSHWVG